MKVNTRREDGNDDWRLSGGCVLFCLKSSKKQETFQPLGLPEGVIKPTYGLAEHTVFVCSGGVQRITVDRRALEIDKQVRHDTSANGMIDTSSAPCFWRCVRYQSREGHTAWIFPVNFQQIST